MEALLKEREARPVQVLEERPVAVRRAVTALFFVNGTLLPARHSLVPKAKVSVARQRSASGDVAARINGAEPIELCSICFISRLSI